MVSWVLFYRIGKGEKLGNESDKNGCEYLIFTLNKCYKGIGEGKKNLAQNNKT